MQILKKKMSIHNNYYWRLKKKLKSSVILFEAPFCHSMYNVVAKIVTVVKII